MVIRKCAEPGCRYLALDNDLRCAVHANIAMVSSTATLGRDYCEAPGCVAEPTVQYEGMGLCDEHGKYAKLLGSMPGQMRAWRVVALVGWATAVLLVVLRILR